MAVDREKVLGELQLNRIPPGLCWGKPEDFIKQLLDILSVSLAVGQNNEFVVIGHQVPSEDDKNRLWVRLARNGSFIGFYLFVKGRWQRIHNYRNDEIIWMFGDSRDIPDGFELIDGTASTIPIDVQERLITQYIVDTTVSGAADVYKYFAVRYVGI